jgi:alpha-tubulin suppressor-like RCC1 family protein
MAKRKAPIKTEAESASLNVSKKSRPLNLNMEVPVISSTKGSLYVLGKNENGQLGLGITKGPEVQSLTLVPSTDEIVEVKSGAKHSIILTKAGEVFTFGSHSDSALGRNIVNDAGKPKKVELPGKVVRISAGDAHSACLLEDGRVFAFGTFKVSFLIKFLIN